MHLNMNDSPYVMSETFKAPTARYNVSGCCSQSLTRRRAPAGWKGIYMKDIYGDISGIEWEILGTVMRIIYVSVYYINSYTNSTAQGGGGSFKNSKPIGEVGCCESRMAERIH